MSPIPKADHLRTELISDALTNALATRDPKAVVVFHSDRPPDPRRVHRLVQQQPSAQLTGLSDTP